MAQLQYVVENKLHGQAKQKDAFTKSVVALIGCVLTIVCGAAVSANLAIVVAGRFFVLTVVARAPDARIRVGAEGEDVALRALKALPDTYTVFNQLDIPSEQSRTGVREADLLVCGPNAIFVIEVKANHGKIFCNEGKAQWRVGKVGRGGTAYQSAMRNPIAQCKSLIWCLSEHLKFAGAKPWIQGIALFTHPDAKLVREGELSIPLLTPRDLVEPPRLSRRLHPLRGLSNEKVIEVFTGGPGACGSDGAGAPGRARVAVGGDRFDCREVRMHAGDAAALGTPA